MTKSLDKYLSYTALDKLLRSGEELVKQELIRIHRAREEELCSSEETMQQLRVP